MGSLSFLISVCLKKLKLSTPYVPLLEIGPFPEQGEDFRHYAYYSIGTWMNVSNFDIVLYTVSSMFTFVFTIQGLSVANFFLAEKGIPGVVVVLILIAAFIFLSVALTFLGIFDQIFGVRRVYSSRRRE